MAFLSVREVYKTGAVENIKFDVEAKQRIAIAGETGSGKTTVLKIIGGHAQADKGTVYFRERRVEGPLERLIPGHPGIAYLSQHFELRNNYWVHEILEYANELPEVEADRLYEICRIKHLLNRRTDQLSGGERQRIALARLLSNRPQLLLLDEPFTNLDRLHKNLIKQVISDLGEKLNITCLLVSHDAADILSWADYLIVMKEGRIIQQADPLTIYYQPTDAYTAGLLGDFNILKNGSEAGLFIRPEQVAISTESKNSDRKGVVIQSLFCGNYYLVEVDSNGEKIKVQTGESRFGKGTEVFLRFMNEKSWYL